MDAKDISRLVGEGGSPAGEVLEAPPEHLAAAARSSVRDPRIRRHRCNHELHQYVESFGHDRGRPVGSQGSARQVCSAGPG